MLVKIEDIKTIKGKRLADKYKLEERRVDVYKRQNYTCFSRRRE